MQFRQSIQGIVCVICKMFNWSEKNGGRWLLAALGELIHRGSLPALGDAQTMAR